MITLTRLNGSPIMVNAAHLESIEECPDTRLALTNGKQLYVRESAVEIRELVRDWLRSTSSWHALCDTDGVREGGDRPAPELDAD